MASNAKLGAKTKENLLTEDELKQILSVCEGRERLVVNFLAYTGMRVSEMVHFNKTWIEGDLERIKIPLSQPCTDHYECRKKIMRRGRVVKSSGMWRVKVKSAARSIPVLPELKPFLNSFITSRTSMNEVVGCREDVWRMVKEVTKRAGLQKRVFPHVFRGTLASILAGKDFDSLTIQGWMGWKSIKTADEYIRISPDRLQRITAEKW